MKIRLIFIGLNLFLILLLATYSVTAQDKIESSTVADSVDKTETYVPADSVQQVLAQERVINDYLVQGDAVRKAFDNQKALELYKKALEQEPGSFEALWRISRAHIDIGEHLTEKDDQLAHFETAKLYADSTIAAKPEDSVGYTRRAIAKGKIALFKGVFKSVGIVKSVREDCQKAIELNPEDDIVHYVYARTHYKVAGKSKIFRAPLGLGWGSKKEAKKLFEKAIELKPDFIMYHLDYAILLIDMKKYEEAREYLQKIADIPIVDEDDEAKKEEAKKLLSEIANKK